MVVEGGFGGDRGERAWLAFGRHLCSLDKFGVTLVPISGVEAVMKRFGGRCVFGSIETFFAMNINRGNGVTDLGFLILMEVPLN